MNLKKIVWIFVFLQLALLVQGMSYQVDGAVYLGNSKALFVAGNQVLLYDMLYDRPFTSPPLPFAEYFKGVDFRGVDAIIKYKSSRVYLVQGDQVTLYDTRKKRIEKGFPKSIGETWRGVGFQKLDAGVKIKDKLYFFSGKTYLCYDLKKKKVTTASPLPINEANWSGLSFQQLDAAFIKDLARVYFFRGERFMTYTLREKKADPNTLKSIAAGWEGWNLDARETPATPAPKETVPPQATATPGPEPKPWQPTAAPTPKPIKQNITTLVKGQPEGDELIAPLDQAFEKEVLRLTNVERQKRGLTPLSWSENLAYSARYHAADMAVENYFDHDSFDRKNNRLKKVCGTWERIRVFAENAGAENIAAGNTTPAAVVKSWMNSTGHRANILNGKLKYLGVGYYKWDASTYRTYWVQNFGY